MGGMGPWRGTLSFWKGRTTSSRTSDTVRRRRAALRDPGAEHMTVSGETTQETTQQGVILTDAAAEKARNLLEQEGRDDLALQIGRASCRERVYISEVVDSFPSQLLDMEQVRHPSVVGKVRT